MKLEIGAAHYKIKTAVINMLSLSHECENGDPYKYLNEFLYVRRVLHIHSINANALRLLLFPFSLEEKAKCWLKSLTSMITITIWEELQREFLIKYYMIGNTNKFRRVITPFKANEGETFHES